LGRMRNSLADPTFSAGPGRLSIGLTSTATGTSYHVHLTDAEAQRFAMFVSERVRLTPSSSCVSIRRPGEWDILRGGRGWPRCCDTASHPFPSYRCFARRVLMRDPKNARAGARRGVSLPDVAGGGLGVLRSL
jgi:hypothetical protein